ncbi:MAG: DUF433 domain-containing protein [Cyanothece sp. SIO1E1]|nr:DUF433 domain-containing protein [Cyanothece sp. SIO1E1]
MIFTISADPPPLEINADDVVLVGKTRVTLDTVVSVFKQGTTAEEIVYRYPALKLAEVYATIAFYLNHQQMVEKYLNERQVQAQEVRKLNEARLDPHGIRDRLLSRKHEQEAC